ncbi:MAG: hypothetical protein KIH64_016775 [Mycobacterium sp.]|nr:hypothetical protein [Mycobacterium sp.]
MLTVERHRRIAQCLNVGALALLAVLATGSVGTSSAAPQAPAAPCYNGITPFNPYVDNCAIPNRPPHILGAAPDQTAILNCNFGSGAWRAVCLSQYVNGGNYGGFPGVVIGPGFP